MSRNALRVCACRGLCPFLQLSLLVKMGCGISRLQPLTSSASYCYCILSWTASCGSQMFTTDSSLGHVVHHFIRENICWQIVDSRIQLLSLGIMSGHDLWARMITNLVLVIIHTHPHPYFQFVLANGRTHIKPIYAGHIHIHCHFLSPSLKIQPSTNHFFNQLTIKNYY